MFNVLLGSVILASATLGFWFVLPGADGKVQPWIARGIMEPVVAIGVVLATTLGAGLIISTIVASLI